MIENNRSKKKLPRYAVAYNMILKWIQEGQYPEGSKLPTEPELAVQMEIGRSTLRHALKLLEEDGIIESRHGLGNFVRMTFNKSEMGLEKMGNPLYKCCTRQIERVETVSYMLGLGDEYTKLVFHREIPALLNVGRSYIVSEKIIAGCFSVIDMGSEEMKKIDLHNQQEVLAYLEEKVYEEAHRIQTEIQVLKEKEVLKEKLIENLSGYCMVIKETIYNGLGKVIIHNKYYIPVEHAVVKVNCYNI